MVVECEQMVNCLLKIYDFLFYYYFWEVFVFLRYSIVIGKVFVKGV